MLTSWNVNQFLRKYSWEELKGQENEKIKIWNSAKDYYFSFIKKHILTDSDILILHEVPFNKENSRKKICVVYEELNQFCAANEFEILPVPVPEPDRKKCYFKTVAVFKKGAYETEPTFHHMTFDSYANRIIAVKRKGEEYDEIIVGLHIPVLKKIVRYESFEEYEEFWKNLISLHEKFPKNKRIIYVGDLNTYDPGTFNKNKLHKLMSKGVVDVWLEKGNRHEKETCDSQRRIDYVLMTSKDFYERSCNINLEVDDAVRHQGYSDHSALVLYQE